MKEIIKLQDDLLSELDALLDRAFVEENKVAQDEVLEVVRGASAIVIQSCILLRTCRIAFGYHLARGNIEKAEQFFSKFEEMVTNDLFGSEWDSIIIGYSQYRLLLNKKIYGEAMEAARKLISNINLRKESIELSLKFDIRP